MGTDIEGTDCSWLNLMQRGYSVYSISIWVHPIVTYLYTVQIGSLESSKMLDSLKSCIREVQQIQLTEMGGFHKL